MGLARHSPVTAAEAGADLHLVHPATAHLPTARQEPLFEEVNGEQMPVTIRVLGRDAKAVLGKVREIERRRAKGEKIEAEDAAVEAMSAAIVGWSDALGIEAPGDLPFSPEAARKLLTDDRTSWIAEQIGPFSLSRSNFRQSNG